MKAPSNSLCYGRDRDNSCVSPVKFSPPDFFRILGTESLQKVFGILVRIKTRGLF